MQLHLEDRFLTMLSAWFDFPHAFREMLAYTSSVISGSAALQFVAPSSTWTCKDLDLYTPFGKPCADLLRHLTEVQGYTVLHVFPVYQTRSARTKHHATSAQPEHKVATKNEGCVPDSTIDSSALAASSNPDPKSNLPSTRPIGQHDSATICFIHSIHILQKTVQRPNDTPLVHRIDIICSDLLAALLPVSDFHSTCVMNAITATGVVVAYPSLTLHGRNLRRLHCLGARQEHSNKYADRGFLPISSPDFSVERCSPSSYPQLRRSSRDAACLSMPFYRSSHPLHDVRDVSWGLHGPFLSICPVSACSYRPVV